MIIVQILIKECKYQQLKSLFQRSPVLQPNTSGLPRNRAISNTIAKNTALNLTLSLSLSLCLSLPLSLLYSVIETNCSNIFQRSLRIIAANTAINLKVNSHSSTRQNNLWDRHLFSRRILRNIIRLFGLRLLVKIFSLHGQPCRMKRFYNSLHGLNDSHVEWSAFTIVYMD